MKYYGKRSLASFLKVLLDILLFIGTILFVWVSVETLSKGFNNLEFYKKMVICFMFILGSIALMLVIINLRRIMKSVVDSNPFIKQNVKSLKTISISCFIIANCYLINFFMNIKYGKYNFIFIDKSGIHTDMEFLIFFFAGSFILVLYKVFEKAVEVKEENDFTI
ncbi:DUF2975 domain-containing protein [Haloimpatiens sp. FM7315]|uniref:DUF2975 domain-containing protein n=1 Tax=Haloimpatiens sp. FM7315 TaxID=3298609 RepID=UPI0035A2BF34